MSNDFFMNIVRIFFSYRAFFIGYANRKKSLDS